MYILGTKRESHIAFIYNESILLFYFRLTLSIYTYTKLYIYISSV